MALPTWLPVGFDRYDLRARLTPAFLVLLPPLFAYCSLRPSGWDSLASALALLPALGIWYLMANVTRSRGRRVEPELWIAWGGAPSTQAMRYAGGFTDRHTLARYHRILGKKAGLKMPSEQDEQRDPKAADAVYDSALRWLREQTRDEKSFPMLKDENIQYGFRRNAYGVRWFGVGACLLALAGAIAHYLMRTDPSALTWRTFAATVTIAESLSVALATLMALVWAAYFTREQVRDAAFAYATALLSACEKL
jgi:hypothetical protein